MNYRIVMSRIARSIYAMRHNTDLDNKKIRRKFYKDFDKEEYYDMAIWLIGQVPSKCPVYQCSGHLETKIRSPPDKGASPDEYSDGYPGDDQNPDLECDDCYGMYKFMGFRSIKLRKSSKKNAKN